MAIGRGSCPECGLEFNARESSIGTMKRCQGCGAKFVLHRKPPSFAGIFLLVIIAGLLYWKWNSKPESSSPGSTTISSPPLPKINAIPNEEAVRLASQRHIADLLNADKQYLSLRSDVLEKDKKLAEARKQDDVNEQIARSSEFNHARAKLEDYEKQYSIKHSGEQK
jgi:DNA-directed RNA polymerase subunit RPC12/RpoP